jgi:hypothetical protein
MFSYQSNGAHLLAEQYYAFQEYSTNCSLLSVPSSFFMSSGEVRHAAGDAAFNTINSIDGGTDLSGLSATCPVLSLTLNFIS